MSTSTTPLSVATGRWVVDPGRSRADHHVDRQVDRGGQGAERVQIEQSRHEDAAGAGEGTYAPPRVRPPPAPVGGGFWVGSVFGSSPAMSTSGSEVPSCCS